MIPEVCLFRSLSVWDYSHDLCPLYNQDPSVPRRLYNDMGTQDKYSCWDGVSSVHQQPRNPVIFREAPVGLHGHDLLAQILKYRRAGVE